MKTLYRYTATLRINNEEPMTHIYSIVEFGELETPTLNVYKDFASFYKLVSEGACHEFGLYADKTFPTLKPVVRSYGKKYTAKNFTGAMVEVRTEPIPANKFTYKELMDRMKADQFVKWQMEQERKTRI